MTSPSSTGNSTICTMDHAIEPASTGMYSPASHSASTGVSRGASRVETVVIATERATSPLARYDTTFDAVPPGQQPTRMTPAASAGGSCSAAAISQPRNGMMAYCATTPITTGMGRLAIMAKSGAVSVSPMPNMMIPRSGLIQAASPVNAVGAASATAPPARIRMGKRVTATRALRSSAAEAVGEDSDKEDIPKGLSHSMLYFRIGAR